MPTDEQRQRRKELYEEDKSLLHRLISRAELERVLKGSNFEINLTGKEILALARLLRQANKIIEDNIEFDQQVGGHETYATR